LREVVVEMGLSLVVEAAMQDFQDYPLMLVKQLPFPGV
jgi:hypothetical protein